MGREKVVAINHIHRQHFPVGARAIKMRTRQNFHTFSALNIQQIQIFTGSSQKPLQALGGLWIKTDKRKAFIAIDKWRLP